MTARVGVTVLHGSPKGEISITHAYLKHLQVSFPDTEISVIPIAAELRRLESDSDRWNAVVETVERNDIVLWAFPVYFYSAPAQVVRFVELVRERKSGRFFQGKYTAAFATSIRCFDHTALNYIQAVSEDLGMGFVDGYTADMFDILEAPKRHSLELFFSSLLWSAKNRSVLGRRFAPVSAAQVSQYQPRQMQDVTTKTEDCRVALITDTDSPESTLARMTTVFEQRLAAPLDILNLRDLHIKDYCRGCVQCTVDMSKGCIIKDDVAAAYDRYINRADIIVFALTIRDRFFSVRFKKFLDRLICRGACFRFDDKQVSFLVSGPLFENHNLVEWMKGFAEFRGIQEVGIVGDKQDSDVTSALSKQNLGCRSEIQLEQGSSESG